MARWPENQDKEPSFSESKSGTRGSSASGEGREVEVIQTAPPIIRCESTASIMFLMGAWLSTPFGNDPNGRGELTVSMPRDSYSDCQNVLP